MESDYIFDQNIYNSVDHSKISYKMINDDPAKEYIEGALIFEGDTISPVGIRYKGVSVLCWMYIGKTLLNHLVEKYVKNFL